MRKVCSTIVDNRDYTLKARLVSATTVAFISCSGVMQVRGRWEKSSGRRSVTHARAPSVISLISAVSLLSLLLSLSSARLLLTNIFSLLFLMCVSVLLSLDRVAGSVGVHLFPEHLTAYA